LIVKPAGPLLRAIVEDAVAPVIVPLVAVPLVKELEERPSVPSTTATGAAARLQAMLEARGLLVAPESVSVSVSVPVEADPAPSYDHVRPPELMVNPAGPFDSTMVEPVVAPAMKPLADVPTVKAGSERLSAPSVMTGGAGGVTVATVLRRITADGKRRTRRINALPARNRIRAEATRTPAQIIVTKGRR
jgi:hypothetical protein